MIDRFFEYSPYELDHDEKSKLITDELKELTRYHRAHCEEYSRFLAAVGYREDKVFTATDIPFFPVRMFKEIDLLSIDKEDVFKTMTSSGTSGQRVSKIFVDQETAMLQNKILLKILGDYWGKKRLPMLVIDSQAVLKDRTQFTARGAAIMGLQMASTKMVYALNDDMSLNKTVIEQFLENYGNNPFIIFGFTSLVWLHLYRASVDEKLLWDMSNAWLMTGGGWKKMEESSVSHEEFKRKLNEAFGIKQFLDHYGMVEQTGCIYAECECGHLHTSIYSDVFARRAEDFSVCEIGEKGILQVVSVLPHSYPGHSLLTEDEGIIMGEDDCPCGRRGKYIKILGRLKSAELRGCSDTYADRFSNN